ncbi:MAG: urease accessory protein UreD [Proteobacteria bacterium]|nr:urease accessory protein UreD [Pseudomonadota bacterium]
MSAPATGDLPQLSLCFSRGRGGRTELTARRVAYPWSLTQPFHLEDGPSGMATVIPQSASGGLFSDDVVRQCIIVKASAAVHLASQGATLAHARRAGDGARSEWRLQVDDGGWLEVLNDPLVLGPDAAVRQHWSLQVAPGGTCLLIDAWTWLRNGAAPAFECLQSEIHIRRPDGKSLALERATVRAGDIERLQSAFAAPVRGFVNGLLLCPGIDHSLTALLSQRLDEIEHGWVGISTLPNEAGIAVRAACLSNGAMAPVSETIWQVFRQWRLGREPARRRRGL